MTDDRNDPSPAHFDDSWQHCWAGLQAKGHALKALDEPYGNLQVIVSDPPSGRLEAAADPRWIGTAATLP